MTMTREEKISAIIEYFEENEEDFNCCIEELDSCNGYLGDDRYYEVELLSEFYNGVDPVELLQRAYYGRDDDTWTTDSSGNKVYGEFCPNRDYFYYNGYGNLVSSDYKDYSGFLDHYAIESMADHRQYIYEIGDNEELKELFDALEEDEDEEKDDEEEE